jgi:anti-anti-sigma regulatory factor
MKNVLESELGKTGMTLETVDGLTILNLGDEINLVDLSFLWSALYGTERKSLEWQLLFNSDQLLINFTKVEYIDQISNEFSELDKEYQRVKGKGIIFCGIQEKIENVIKFTSGADYNKLIIFDTWEVALDYYWNQKGQEH